jgi:hypothetical protein
MIDLSKYKKIKLTKKTVLITFAVMIPIWFVLFFLRPIKIGQKCRETVEEDMKGWSYSGSRNPGEAREMEFERRMDECIDKYWF